MTNIPLAERLRPRDFKTFIGQKHLIGEGAVLRNAINAGNIPSMIFWGPPGVGKTTLARIIASKLNQKFYSLSAINSGVKDIRNVIDSAINDQEGAILFIDEIHRFSKSQQDSLLGAVEKGIVTLIGATTENPSFEVISPLLSRCQVYILRPFEENELIDLLNYAISEDVLFKNLNIKLEETEALLRISGGDARKLLNALELVVNSEKTEVYVITDKKVLNVVQQNLVLYDKMGEMHYDIISAFIKSMRGSDPNATVYWLSRMVQAGEDVKFIARRMLIFASEDIGMANPTAMILANNCFQAVNVIGYPESDIILSQTAVYLATSVKSNASYMAIKSAHQVVETTGDLPVPLHIRNAPTKFMKNLNYGKDYKYPHDFEGNFTQQEYLPDKIKNTILYDPGNNIRENDVRKRMKELWKNKYKY
ncbi:MAG: replication-associated recombination protein A [Bacteroidota bacterium]|nr:replication-associated recombination protein A [Bacteroidota bacterium]